MLDPNTGQPTHILPSSRRQPGVVQTQKCFKVQKCPKMTQNTA